MARPRLLPALACLLLALAPAAHAQGELDQARAKLNEAAEGSCKEAAAICVRANNVAAVELLLEVLRTWEDRKGFLPEGHYRDIAWGALGEITDPYARRRVETELKTNKQSAWARQWCAELLGIYGDPEYEATLLKALDDPEIGVQRAAALALGKCKAKRAVKALSAQAYASDYILRTNAVDALMRIDAATHRPLLLRALRTDKNGGVRCALLAVAAELLPAEAEELSTKALGDPDWRPRMQSVDNLGKVKTKSAVDALIRTLADGRPAVAARANRRLQELTGQKHRTKAVWEAWWRDHRETFEFPESVSAPAPDPGGTVAYHGVDLRSDHVAFLLDVSAKMGETLASKQMSKADAALEELEAVLDKLEGRLTFNLFCYAEDSHAFEEKDPVELSARNKKKALDFVRNEPRGRQKDIWKALTSVLEDPELDTAFLLSSGEPDIGTYVHWNRVTWQLVDLNRFHKVTFHTIAYTDSDWYRQQLEKIAEVTGGEFRSFE